MSRRRPPFGRLTKAHVYYAPRKTRTFYVVGKGGAVSVSPSTLNYYRNPRYYVGSGGGVASGSAEETIANPHLHYYTGIGGAFASGTAAKARTRARTSVGGASASGTAARARTRARTGVGGASASGAATTALVQSAGPRFSDDFRTGTVVPAITTTRVNVGTRHNSSGLIVAATANQPRIDWDPTTLQARGLLQEEARTNLLVQSENFGTTWLSNGNATIATNTTTAPDGTGNADSILEAASPTSVHAYYQNIDKAASPLTYSLSIFVKGLNRTYAFLGISDNQGNGYNIGYSLSTGAVTLTGGDLGSFGTGFTGASGYSIAYPNGWWRLVMTITSNSWAGISCYVGPMQSATVAWYNGNTANGLYVWGAQAEQAATASSYIPTTVAQATRDADIYAMPLGGISGYSATQGTWVMALRPGGITGVYQSFFSFDDGTLSERYTLIRYPDNTIHLHVDDGGVAQVDIDLGALAANTETTIAFRYQANNFAVCRDGIPFTLATDSGDDIIDDLGNQLAVGIPLDIAATLPTPTTARFLSNPVPEHANGWLSWISYYNVAKTDRELESLSVSTVPDQPPVLPPAVQPVSWWESRFLAQWPNELAASNALIATTDSADMYTLAYVGLDANISMWRASGNTQYLDRVLSYINALIGTSRVANTIPGNPYTDTYRGWGNINGIEGHGSGAEIWLDDIFCWRHVGTLLRHMKNDPAIMANPTYSGQWTTIYNFLELNIWDKWRARGGLFYDSIHIMTHWVLVNLAVGKLSSNSTKRTQAMQFVNEATYLGLGSYASSWAGQSLANNMRQNPNVPTAYWFGGFMGLFEATGYPWNTIADDIGHGGAVLNCIAELYDAGVYWTAAHISKLVGLVRDVILADTTPPYTFPCRVDGTCVTAAGDPATGDGWMPDGGYCMGRYDVTLQQRIEVHAQNHPDCVYFGTGALCAKYLLQGVTRTYLPTGGGVASGAAATMLGPLQFGRTVLAVDTFTRSVAIGSGWGTCDTGQVWTASNNTFLGVTNGAGAYEPTTINSVRALRLDYAGATDQEIIATIRQVVVGTLLGARVRVRSQSNAAYPATYEVGWSQGSLAWGSSGGGLAWASFSPTDGAPQVGETWHLRVSCVGSGPVRLRAKAWKEGSPEPATWTVDRNDTVGYLTGGQPGFVFENASTSGGAASGGYLKHYQVLAAGTDPATYGAVGDGVTNDTAAWQSCVNAATAGAVIDGMGRTYAVSRVNLKSNLTVQNANFVVKFGLSTNGTSALSIGDNYDTGTRSNITIRNVTVDGNRNNHTGIGGLEDGGRHGFRIVGHVTDVLIDNCSATMCASDGIELYQGAGSRGSTPASTPILVRIVVQNSTFTWNRRLGGSGDAMQDCQFIDCIFENNGKDTGAANGGLGTNPKGGFDLEGYDTGSKTKGLTFTRCIFRNNQVADQNWVGYYPVNQNGAGWTRNEDITFDTCTFDTGSAGANPCLQFSSAIADKALAAEFYNIRLLNCTIVGHMTFRCCNTVNISGGTWTRTGSLGTLDYAANVTVSLALVGSRRFDSYDSSVTYI